MNILKRKNNLVVSIDPNVHGGTPVISNTRVPVIDIVYLYKKKKISPEEIALKYYSYLSFYQITKSIEWYELNYLNYEGLDL